MKESKNQSFTLLSSVTVNIFYATLLVVFVIDSRREIQGNYLIAPLVAFLFLQAFIFLTNWRLPTLVQFKALIPSHILLLFEVSFVTMDVFGYLEPKKLQILLRISTLLLEYIMINNIFLIVEKGYSYQENFTLDLLVWNAEHIIYESLFLTVGSIVQFALYGDHIQSIYFIASLVVAIVVISVQFVYGFGLWKVIGANINDL